MKKFYYLLLLSVIALFSACDENDWNSEDLMKTEGTLLLSSLDISIDNSIYDANNSKVDSVTILGSSNTSDFIINIIEQQSQRIINTWKYGEMPNDITLKKGEYTIEVKSHEANPAEWEKPYFYGSKKISINKNETTIIDEINCCFANVKVNVEYSADLASVLGDDAIAKVYITNDATLEFSRNEVRSGYFYLPSATSSLVAEFSGTINNEPFSVHKVIPDVKAGQSHTFSFSFDDLKNVENPNAPSITSETISVDGINFITDTIIAKVDINAPYGIKNFVVDIISEQLTKEVIQEVGLDATFDLANPGELVGPLTELGFPTGSAVVGQTYLAFDITDFMQLLNLFPGQHQFKLTVVDSKGNTTSKTLTFVTQQGPTTDSSAPTITSETLDIDSANYITESIIAKVDINAPNGIKNFVVDIISEQLTPELLKEVGLDSTFDLANPGELAGPLGELGFPTGEAVVGKTYLAFDITDFMQLLVLFPGQHQFKLTITDKADNMVSKTLTFIAQ